MLLSVLSTEYDARSLERRLGFSDVYPVLNDVGGERFGAVQLSGGGLSGIIQLRGLNHWLGGVEQERDALARIRQHLPDFPVQFILQRRLLDTDAYLADWRKRIARRFVNQPEAGEMVWADFKGRMVARWREYGAAAVWCGLAVSGVSEAELGRRLALLYTSLPFEANALNAAEITDLLRGYLRPGSRPTPNQNAQPLNAISPNSLYLSNDGILLEHDTSLTFYTAQPPTPAAPAAEWLWPILRSDALANVEYDLCVHIQPARYEVEMQLVLERRLTHIAARLAEIAAHQEAQLDDGDELEPLPAPDRRDTERLKLVYSRPVLGDAEAEREGLHIERREVEQRLAQLQRGEERLREMSIMFTLRAPGPQVGSSRARFVGELERLGFSPQPLKGKPNIERGLRSSLPLDRNQAGRQFTLTAAAAAPLLWLASSHYAQPDLPPLGLARDRSIIGFAPEASGEPGHRTISGGHDPQRSYIIRQFALLNYIAGYDLYGYDPAGEWREFVTALGGSYITPGAMQQGGDLNLIAAARPALDDPDRFQQWVTETTALLSKLAGGLDEEQTSHLSAALFQLGLSFLERNQPLTLQRLYADVRAGGYTPLARALNIIARGRWKALFSEPQPRELGKGDENFPMPVTPLLFIGRADDLPADLADYLSALVARRLLTALQTVAPGVEMPSFQLRRASAIPTVLFADAPAALDDPTLSGAISDALDDSSAMSIWLLADRAERMLTDPANALLLSRIPHHLLLKQEGSEEVAALFGLSARAAHAVPNLARNQALLAGREDFAIVNVV